MQVFLERNLSIRVTNLGDVFDALVLQGAKQAGCDDDIPAVNQLLFDSIYDVGIAAGRLGQRHHLS